MATLWESGIATLVELGGYLIQTWQLWPNWAVAQFGHDSIGRIKGPPNLGMATLAKFGDCPIQV